MNLELCRDAGVKEFLRAIQLHCFKYSIFETCISDLGSQIQAGANMLKTFFSDHETRRFLGQHGVREFDFQHYPKGNSSLGALVEVCVKQAKLLINKAIG